MLNYGSEVGYQTSYRSAWGTCFHIFVTIITVIFTVEQINIWLKYKDTKFMSYIVQDYFDDDSSGFTEEDGFQIAFAVDYS